MNEELERFTTTELMEEIERRNQIEITCWIKELNDIIKKVNSRAKLIDEEHCWLYLESVDYNSEYKDFTFNSEIVG
mgnify:FL=1